MSKMPQAYFGQNSFNNVSFTFRNTTLGAVDHDTPLQQPVPEDHWQGLDPTPDEQAWPLPRINDDIGTSSATSSSEVQRAYYNDALEEEWFPPLLPMVSNYIGTSSAPSNSDQQVHQISAGAEEWTPPLPHIHNPYLCNTYLHDPNYMPPFYYSNIADGTIMPTTTMEHPQNLAGPSSVNPQILPTWASESDTDSGSPESSIEGSAAAAIGDDHLQWPSSVEDAKTPTPPRKKQRKERPQESESKLYEETSDGRWRCLWASGCRDTFLRLQDLQRHQKRKDHAGPQVSCAGYECPCGQNKMFRDKNAAKRHSGAIYKKKGLPIPAWLEIKTKRKS